ncbi:hypothetical protein RJ640_028099, partial [Escallonia rubra]
MAAATGEDKKSPAKRVAVVGAGVSGLAAAYKLKLHGLNVTIFEAEGRAGGKLRTVSQNGLIWDEGANTMTETEVEVSYLLDKLGLRGKQQFPIAQNKRYIARNGKPVRIPSDPIALIRSNFLSAQSKMQNKLLVLVSIPLFNPFDYWQLQLLLEPFLWQKSSFSKVSDTHESVGGFFQRHFGKEVVDYLIDPFVAGSSAGDPESLSMRHAFPELLNLEERFGSIILGTIRSKLSAKNGKGQGMKDTSANKKQRRGSFSFLGGMQTLTDAICEELGEDKLHFQSKVLQLSSSCNGNSPLENWSVTYASNHHKHLENQSFDAVIMTAPLCDVKEMKIRKRGTPVLLDFLPEVTYMPLSVVITTFKKENVKRPLEGFGVLIPSKEQQNGLKTLGTLFSSMMFPDRAPSDLYLYTTFVGGSRNKELAKASREELKQIVTSDLRQLLGAEGEPTFMNQLYWSKAFPLYGHNYDSVLEAIEKLEKDLPGFYYAGNHRGGLSVGKALSSGCKAADLVISYLDSSSREKLPTGSLWK